MKSIHICIIPPEPTDIHPETGLQQLNFDQFLHVQSRDINKTQSPLPYQHLP